ncbi:MAG: 23S rRNA (adenine(2503)-C(2))-methyltransferase RlmN [Anaerolineaceae bacterium]|nr:23S rRNA (adenine(2503)-C(2))-methyltransferase RlmN [Anaerolineaceae bacterium]
MTEMKPLIYDLNLEALTSWFAQQKQPAYRAKQIWSAVYKQFINHPDEISTLSKTLREQIADAFDLIALDPVRTLESADGQTVKTLFKLRDGQYIEAVLMYYDERRTLCISSQSGCGMGCTFCATGQMGFRRNLSSGEIIAQVLYFARLLARTGDHVTNIVMMGMGEPFHNFDNVMEALNRLNDPEAFGLGARHITLSTVGLIPKIKQFADLNTQYNLAISLHSVDNDLRASMMPVSKKYKVPELLDACRYYINKTNRRITFEYALIDGVNDSTDDAEALAKALRGMICHVNLIPLNPTRGFQKEGTRSDQVSAFADVLEQRHIPVTVRMRRGIEIAAGCGQLASEVKNGS